MAYSIISKCPYCLGKPIVDLEARITGFIHLINCPVMLELRGEGTDEYRRSRPVFDDMCADLDCGFRLER